MLWASLRANMINCDCDEHGEQVEGDMAHPMSLLLIGCNKVLGLLVMLYLAYRSSFMSSYHFHPLDIMMIPFSSVISSIFDIDIYHQSSPGLCASFGSS